MKIDSLLLHGGSQKPGYGGAVTTPIFQSATYLSVGEEAKTDPVRYIRLNNTPNHQLLHQRIATIEDAEAALVTNSGMSAITTALLSQLRAGDHLLVQKNLYGGTFGFITNELPNMGIEVDFLDIDKPMGWEKALRENTRAIYVESISNPLMQVPDLNAVIDFARKNQLVSLIDNTFASPINFKPIPFGFDIVLHSATKYLNGHSDIVAGVIVASEEIINNTLPVLNRMGGSLDPNSCFLLERGLKTLSLRVNRQNSNAQQIAEYLAGHTGVKVVHYPGLESHSDYQLAARMFNGFGGMMSFELLPGNMPLFFDTLKLAAFAPSLGGVESLITLPATTSHVSLSQKERHQLGIGENLIRFSVGIEDVGDLIEDLEKALKKYRS